MNVYLKPDTKIIRNCIPMTIIEVDETYRNVVIREDKYRRNFSLSHDEFFSEYADAKIKFVVSDVAHACNDDVTMRTLVTYTEKQIDKAKQIKGLILACLDENGRWNSNTKERASSKLDYARSTNMKGQLMSDRQLRRLYARWDANNRNIEALIERTEKRGNRTVRIDDEMLALANKFITEFYMVGNRPSVAAVHKKLEKFIENKVEYSHLKLISRSTLERMINKIPEYEKFKARFGYLAARREFPHGSPVVKPQYLMQKVEIDHTPIDEELFCDESGELLASVPACIKHRCALIRVDQHIWEQGELIDFGDASNDDFFDEKIFEIQSFLELKLDSQKFETKKTDGIVNLIDAQLFRCLSERKAALLMNRNRRYSKKYFPYSRENQMKFMECLYTQFIERF